jgi:hypothetical protein
VGSSRTQRSSGPGKKELMPRSVIPPPRLYPHHCGRKKRGAWAKKDTKGQAPSKVMPSLALSASIWPLCFEQLPGFSLPHNTL